MATKKLPPEPQKHTPEEMADAIVAVAEGARRLLGSRLSKQAIVLLIQDAIPTKDRPTRNQIADVLTHAADLDRVYLKRR
jgi:hypothetical protein